MFQYQTKTAPIMPNMVTTKGVKVMKSEMIKKIPSKKVLLIIKISFIASATADI